MIITQLNSPVVGYQFNASGMYSVLLCLCGLALTRRYRNGLVHHDASLLPWRERARERARARKRENNDQKNQFQLNYFILMFIVLKFKY